MCLQKSKGLQAWSVFVPYENLVVVVGEGNMPGGPGDRANRASMFFRQYYKVRNQSTIRRICQVPLNS